MKTIIGALTLVAILSGPGLTLVSAGAGEMEGVVLNALLENHPTVQAIAKLLPEFESETGIRVDIEVLPFETMTRRAHETLAQKSPRYDVYMDGWVHGIPMAMAGHLEPLDAYMADAAASRYLDVADFVPAYVSDARYAGRQYGLPVYGESTFLCYRRDVFARYGIPAPQTIEDVREAAASIQKQSLGGLYGITLRGREGIHAVYAWSSFLWGFGGRWLDENARADLDTQAAAAATQCYADLLTQFGPPAHASFGWMENRDIFMRGKAAMTIDATVNGAYNEDRLISRVAGKVGYVPTPAAAGARLSGSPSSLVTHQMYVSRYSRNRSAAFLFIAWATGRRTQVKALSIEPNCGMTSLAALGHPLFQEKYGAFADSMMAAVRSGNPDFIPKIAAGPAIFQRVGSALAAVLAGRESAASAMKRVNRDINTTILK